jgi:glycosidase
MKGSRGTENTDANRRLAMLWGDKDNVENPAGSTYDADRQTNGTVKSQLADENSIYNHYKKVILLREANPEIARGTYTPLEFNGYQNFGGFLSTYQNSTVGVFHNTGMSDVVIDLSLYTNVTFEVVRGYAGQGTATLVGNTLTLSPLTSVIIK